MTQVLTGAPIGPVIVTVGGLALNSVNCKVATTGLSLTLTAVLPTAVAPCRVGWLPTPCNFGGRVVTFFSQVINGLSNAATFSYGYRRSGVPNCLHR
mgnify:CR=1 FL=1